MRTVEFKVVETDPAEYCIVAQDTVSLLSTRVKQIDKLEADNLAYHVDHLL